MPSEKVLAAMRANAERSAGGNLVIHGLEDIDAAFAALTVEGTKELASALYAEALVEQKESMRRTPVMTGALRASHETSKPKIEGDEVSVIIAVGGPAAPYAVIVHEDLERNHPNGQAKFLESTLAESKPYLAARIAKRISLRKMVGR